MEGPDQTHQVYHSLLLRLEGGPSVFVEGEYMTLESVFNKTLEMLASRKFCVCHIYEMVHVARKAISAQYTGNNKFWIIRSLTRLGVLILEVVSRYVTYAELPLTGKWECVVSLALSLMRLWRSGLYVEQEPLMSEALKSWVVVSIRRLNGCPNPVLRLEMLRCIAMFDMDDMMDLNLVRESALGVMQNVIDLSVTRLLPKGRTGLLWPLMKILYQLQITGFLGAFMTSGYNHVRRLVVGDIERSMSYLVVLMGQAAKRVLWLRRNGYLTPLGTVDQLMNILHVLRLLVATPPNHEMFEEPGMCRIAAAAIAMTCRCIVQTPDSPAARQSFVNLVCEMNDFMAQLVFHVKGTVVEELRRYHGGCLSYIATKMNQLGCSAASVPEPLKEVKQPAPERFLDARTGRLMKAPVKLLVSGQVVDRATLLLLKLATAVDPQTGVPVQDLSFESLIYLQDEIHAWKLQQQRLREHT